MKAFYQDIGMGSICALLGKSRQAFYDHRWRSDQQALEEGLVVDLVRAQRRVTPGVGVRKLLHLLSSEWEQHGIRMGRDQFFDLLGRHELLIRRRKKHVQTTQSKHWLRKYPNLAQGLEVYKAEQLWVSDITYVALEGKFIYLMLIMDAYSRKIVGYELNESLNASFCVKALQKALDERQFIDHSLMHHSDRGLQYCSQAYTSILEQHSIAISMTQNGDPYENAMAERLNGILKQEWKLDQTFSSFDEAKKSVDQAVHHYNHSRPHASCNYLTPAQAHIQTGHIPKRWKAPSRKNTTPTIPDFLYVKSNQDFIQPCKVEPGLSFNL
jgi:transposase InsO family protein